jgi:hypothetical protein
MSVTASSKTEEVPLLYPALSQSIPCRTRISTVRNLLGFTDNRHRSAESRHTQPSNAY